MAADAFEIQMALLCGPGGTDLSEAQLRRAWSVYRAELMRPVGPPGDRPWGWWRFELGEEPLEGWARQARRLAELGALDADELEEVRERARGTLEALEDRDAVERTGAIVTAPSGAAERMRARRAQERLELTRLLAD